jgi:hypothetical protein
MTDRYKGFVVTLDRDISEDDAEAVINALRMVKGVVKVEPVEASFDDQIIQTRVQNEVRIALYDALDEVFNHEAQRARKRGSQ